ncbi:predicted protein [Streptomyces sp. AA4]|nr:predicted protein [Streptomyces sp. AA4]
MRRVRREGGTDCQRGTNRPGQTLPAGSGKGGRNPRLRPCPLFASGAGASGRSGALLLDCPGCLGSFGGRFTTVPDALRAARSAAAEKAGSLRGTNYAEPVGRVAGALPGGGAAPAAAHCQDALSTTFTEWCAEAQRLADNLGVAADRYQQGDHTAAGVFPPAAPTMHGPR